MGRRLIAGLSLGLALSLACARPETPQFRTLKNVRFWGADLRSGTALLTAEAEFHNPNGIALDVTSLELVVLLNDQQAATVRQAAGTQAAAHADFTLPIRVDLPLQIVADVLEDEGGSLLGGLLSGKQVDLRVDGWIRVKLRGIEVTAPIQHQERIEIKL